MSVIPQPCDAGKLKSYFAANLPDSTYCSDDLQFGVTMRNKASAIKHKYIKFNPANCLNWMLFDLDYPGARFGYEDGNICPPNLIIENPKNHHAHYAYLMETPIHKSKSSSPKPIMMFDDIRRGMTKKLGADKYFTHFINKNPLHHDWNTIFLRDRPVPLAELNDWLSTEDKRREPQKRLNLETIGEGRNCTLFEVVRHQAYKEVLSFKRSGAYQSDFEAWVLNRLIEENGKFDEPLKLRELFHIAKSISSWTWSHFHIKHSSSKFSDIQSERANKRWENHISVESDKPWEEEGVSRSTWYRMKCVRVP
jgi:hypothetical protein